MIPDNDVVTKARKNELEERWHLVADRLPGCRPYTNQRPCRIKAHEDGLTFVEMLELRFANRLTRQEWLAVFRDELILDCHEEVMTNPDHRVRAGEVFYRLLLDWIEPAMATDLEVIYEDEVLFVIDKPAPLPMHQGGRFFKNTLKSFMADAWPELDVRYTHRLDAETSGTLLCVKGEHYHHQVHGQFERGEIKKNYLARVQGHPAWEQQTIEIAIPRDGRPTGKILPARTEVTVRRRDEDGTALLEVEPVTGRTHQIRNHLWQVGFPIVGDGLYLVDGKKGKLAIGDRHSPPLKLRSWSLTCRHPVTEEALTFQCRERF